MVGKWSKLPDEQVETCASESCEHALATWRMDAGEVGSFYCDDCRRSIVSNAARIAATTSE